MDDQFLKRIDEHMARGNEHMARGNQLMARGDELMDEIREEMRLSRQQHADLRSFIQEQTRRAERVTESQISRLNELGRRIDRGTRAIDDMRDQIRANTEATWRMLDRYPPRGGTAPA